MFGVFGRKLRRRTRRSQSAKSQKHYSEHKERARRVVHERLAYWSAHYGVTYGKVAIRNQRSRWGSCSVNGNLNFNYRIVFLPQELIDYIIVHELCHLIEFNHSPTFWGHVARAIPEYHLHKRALSTLALNSVRGGAEAAASV